MKAGAGFRGMAGRRWGLQGGGGCGMVRRMNNPNYPILDILVRLGIALGLGILIFIVPIALKNARFAPTTFRRVMHIVLARVAAAGFAFGVHAMFKYFVPGSPDEPQQAPMEYPSAPVN